MFSRFWALTLGIGLLAVPPPQSQQRPPVFTAGTDFVQTDVIVRDSRNRLVAGLTAADFVVYEDGVRQKVEVFRPFVGGRDLSVGRRSGSGSSGLIVPPPAVTNATGRLFIVFIDDLNFQFKSTSSVRDIMRLIKTVVQEEDLVGIVSSGYSSIEVDPLHDYGYKRLEEAIAKTSGSGLSSQQIVSAPSTAQGPAELRYKAHTAMRTANDILDKLAAISGMRKAFLYISEGYDFDPFRDSRLKAEQELYGRSPDANAQQNPLNKTGQIFAEADLIADLAELIRNANRANVSLYTIDPRGLDAGPDINETVSVTEHREHLRVSVDTLSALADNTGGLCICQTNNFKEGLERVNNETSDYYLLGYASTNKDMTRRRRIIRIESTKPGLSLTYRTEYTLPRK
jgi:VWFA-related protein